MRRVIENFTKVLLIILLIGWISMIFIDCFRHNDGRKPIFCLKEEVKQYSDGEVYICTGLGYKAFDYNRKTITAKVFGPFFIKEKIRAE